MNRISIIIPMYNEEQHIARTLLAARHAAEAANVECELIVLDNGSDDQGPDIARQFGAQVLVLPGLLIGALRNRGAAIASCLLYTSPSPRDGLLSRMPSSA